MSGKRLHCELRCYRKGVGGMKSFSICSTENILLLKNISMSVYTLKPSEDSFRFFLFTLGICTQKWGGGYAYYKCVCLRSYNGSTIWEGDLVRTGLKIMMWRWRNSGKNLNQFFILRVLRDLWVQVNI